jgi:formate hydrogenlyase transcriptional activator
MQQVPAGNSKTEHPPSIEQYSRRYEVLLRAAEVAARRGFRDLLQELSRLLRDLFDFNFINYAVRDDAANVMRVYMLDHNLRASAPVEFSVNDSPAGWVWSQQKSLMLPDLHVENRFRPAMDLYRSRGLRSVIVLPMTTSRQRLGTLCFASSGTLHCDSDVLHFLERLASLAGLALENSLFLGISEFKEAAAGEKQELQKLAATGLQLSQQSAAAYENLRREREQLHTVVEIQSALAASRLDLPEMFPAMSRSLRQAISHDASFITLWNKTEQSFDVYAVEPEEFRIRMQPPTLKFTNTLTAEVLTRATEGRIVRRKELESERARFPHLQIPLEAGFVTWCVVPMRSADGLVGVLYVGSGQEDAFQEHDLEVLRHLAGALMFYIENSRARSAVEREKDRLKMLLDVSRMLASSLDSKELFQEIASCVRNLMAQDYAHLALYDPATDVMKIRALDFPEGRGLLTNEIALPLSESPAGITVRAGTPKIFNQSELQAIGSDFARKMLAEGIRSVLCVPLVSRDRTLGTIGIASMNANAFGNAEIELLRQLASQVAVALDNSRAYHELAILKDKLAKEKLYLEQEIRDSFNFEQIVGESPALVRVLEQVRTVAPSTASVLILGETGTGKELVARAIHRLSTRTNSTFVKINCAAIPTGLLESELFGHEKGAFTGAISQKIGRLELADKGTLFLDEVGEIPLELQPKLLRVLQDQEFERLGGNRTIRVNVRVLAATNRDLSAAVARHEFRSDLYYRLHVFPIRVPSLRERREDIRLLVIHFMQKFARRMNKQIENIAEDAMLALEQWHWPGNIRELENFIERSVILTEGTTLRVPVGELRPLSNFAEVPQGLGSHTGLAACSTLESLEREYIVLILRQSAGVISGSRGAAARLGMKRTTLQSKIQRLGIRREEYEA